MNRKPLSRELQSAISILRNARLETEEGMPEELFLLLSGLIPLPNVDLLVTNSENQLLLSRRNDGFYETSWHIPGGCMRYGESFARRIQETALRELGTNILTDYKPISIGNVIRGANPELEYPRERGHNVAILFACRLPEGFQISNEGRTESDNGFLRWFDQLPPDFMKIQHVYDDVLVPWMMRNDPR